MAAMGQRFAVLECVQKIEDIPIKYQILKQCSPSVMDWYVQKYNPFTVSPIQLAGEEGLRVTLPMTEDELRLYPDKREAVTAATLQALRDYRVDILLPPKAYPMPFPGDIPVATGQTAFAFFLMPAIQRALRTQSKDVKNAEILIIGAPDGLTALVLDRIYPHVNYLSLLVPQPEDVFAFAQKSEDIFAECGLNLHVTTKNKAMLECADVVINLSESDTRHAYYYQRGAIYFDLSKNRRALMELIGRRDDLIAIDSLQLTYRAFTYVLAELELILFVKSMDCRDLMLYPYNPAAARRLSRFIRTEGVEIRSFRCLDKTLNHTYFRGALGGTL